jgi:hypothetical protein
VMVNCLPCQRGSAGGHSTVQLDGESNDAA